MKKLVIAIGGNAITKNGQKGTQEEQLDNIQICCDQLASLIQSGYQIILTHGNGPQVGNIVLQNDIARPIIPENSLDLCDAATQGILGYMLARTLSNTLKSRNIQPKIITMLTQVVVDSNDSAFLNPTKFIGPFYSLEEANQLTKEKGYIIKKDSSRGYRRVVPSPKPLEIVEIDAMKDLSQIGYTLIIAGGGGIPVVKENNKLIGIEAVIDKDYTSSLVATKLNADSFIILTEVDQVAIDYGKPTMKWINHMSIDECKNYLSMGQFPEGSMGPKIKAALSFAEQTNKEAIITSLSSLSSAIKNGAGTHIL